MNPKHTIARGCMKIPARAEIGMVYERAGLKPDGWPQLEQRLPVASLPSPVWSPGDRIDI